MATFRKLESGKWFAEVYVNRIRKSKTHPNKASATAWANQTEHDLRSLGKGVSQTHTLSDLWERYMAEECPRKAGARWEIARLTALQRDPVAQVKLVDLDREDFAAWIKRREKAGVCGATILRELTVISHAFRKARVWRLMSHNPLDDLERPKDNPARMRRISDDEIATVLASLGYHDELPVRTHKHRIAVGFLIAIETGMRAGEICSIEPQRLDYDRRTVLLRDVDTKTRTERVVPLSTRAVELFRKLEPFDDLPVIKRVSDEVRPIMRMKSGTLSTIFRAAVGTTGIENLTFHDTRHEAITRLAKKIHVLDLARMVGHSNINELMTYYNRQAHELATELD